MPIEMRDFSAGWIPSDDDYNGRKNGFLQMDNCTLDENGSITLARGQIKLTNNKLSSIPHTIYSRHIGNNFYRYAALAEGSVVRDTNLAQTFATALLTGGSSLRADFASALNQVFIISGTKFIKDAGATQSNIGIAAPTVPTVAQYGFFSDIDLQNLDGSNQFTNWTCDIGTLNWNNLHNDIQFVPDATLLQAVIRTVYGSPIDLTTYPADVNWPIGYQTQNDNIQFWMSFADGTQIVSVTINLYTYDPGATGGTTLNSGTYYSHTWNSTDSPAPFLGGDNWNHLKAQISDFSQNGNTTASGWNAIKAITITVIAASAVLIQMASVEEYGGTRASQNGTYQYYTQNVDNTGSYQGLSAISTASTPLQCLYGALILTLIPPSDPNVTQINIYRQEVNTQAQATLLATIAAATTSYLDGLSDISLLANSGVTANLFLQSVQSITENILSIMGLYFGRMLYFSATSIYISDELDPDAFDSRYIIKYSSNSTEIFLWVLKVANGVIYVATNHDIYQVTGTFSVLPDGTLDATITPLGVSYPPVSSASATESGSAVYMATDGWRILGAYGDDSQNISTDLNLLFKGYTLYGLTPFATGYKDTVVSRCKLNKGKFYTIVTLQGGGTEVLVFDVLKKSWYPLTNTQMNCLFTEEDGTLIAGGLDSNIYQMDTPGNYLNNGAQQFINLLTPIFDGGTPRQRKDTFTIKVRYNTGGSNLTLSVYKDGVLSGTTYQLNSNVPTEQEIDALIQTLGKGYQFRIQGQCAFFELYFISMEYTDRPIQLTRLRLAPSNFQSSGKKRMFTCPPFVIDTLGNNVTFQPEIDGQFSVVANPNINTTEKTTIVPTFSQEVIATDAGGILTGGPFEFYGVFEDDWLVEKIPTGRLVDQAGPFEALRLASLERFRYRCIAEGAQINYSVFVEDVNMYSNSFITISNVDKTYEIVLPKGLNGTTFRIVFTSPSLIHRYTCKVKLRITGGQTEGKWV